MSNTFCTSGRNSRSVWQVSTSGGWTYTAPRSLILQVIADF
ncbi:MAG: hypothetical protein ACKOQM_02070 [Novosphingobium sp.]